MQLKHLDPATKIAGISIEGRQYEVRDGVVTVHKEHVAGAKLLGFGHPVSDEAPEVGKPLTNDERAELEALRAAAAERAKAQESRAPEATKDAPAAKTEIKASK